MNAPLAPFMLLVGLCIMVASCFSEVTLLPGLAFGGILMLAGISLQFSRPPSKTGQSRSSSTSERYPIEIDTRDDMYEMMAALDGRRGRTGSRFQQFDILMTDIAYGDFKILVTHTPTNGYAAEIRDTSHIDTLDGYASIDDALRGAKQHIDTVLSTEVTG